MSAVDETDLSDLDLKDLSDAQLATLVRALDEDGEPTALQRFSERELARRARRRTLQ
jgi:hypothetical protein